MFTSTNNQRSKKQDTTCTYQTGKRLLKNTKYRMSGRILKEQVTAGNSRKEH